MLMDVEGKDVETWLSESKSHALIFFHTPLCGTCQLALRILSIALEAMGDRAPIVAKCNLNTVERNQIEAWEIQSVPCLARFAYDDLGHKFMKEKHYALASVTDVYGMILKDSDDS